MGIPIPMIDSLFYLGKMRYLAHPFSTSNVLCTNHAVAAAGFVLMRPLPLVAGVRFVDAQRASKMNFGLSISGCFSMW